MEKTDSPTTTIACDWNICLFCAHRKPANDKQCTRLECLWRRREGGVCLMTFDFNLNICWQRWLHSELTLYSISFCTNCRNIVFIRFVIYLFRSFRSSQQFNMFDMAMSMMAIYYAFRRFGVNHTDLCWQCDSIAMCFYGFHLLLCIALSCVWAQHTASQHHTTADSVWAVSVS